MKRRRSSAPGRLRPDGRWSHPILLAALLVALAACGQVGVTDQPSPSGQASSNAPDPSGTTSTDPAIGTPTDAPTASAEPSTSGSSASPRGTPPPGSGSAASCSGSDENRDFFASMAAAVGWSVYCPVLPDGWFVADGQYRLAGGGWMEISYQGPGDARITLRQGAFCTDGGGCVPSGREAGETAFGDRIGTLLASNDGSWSVIVEPGATPSWLLTVTGLDEASARTIAASLHAVSG